MHTYTRKEAGFETKYFRKCYSHRFIFGFSGATYSFILLFYFRSFSLPFLFVFIPTCFPSSLSLLCCFLSFYHPLSSFSFFQLPHGVALVFFLPPFTFCTSPLPSFLPLLLLHLPITIKQKKNTWVRVN